MNALSPLSSTAAIRHRVERVRYALRVLETGLNGQPNKLDKADGESVIKILGSLGIELVSKTALEKRGHVLRKGARPVMARYYGAPIQKYIDLYVFQAQTKPSHPVSR